MKRPNVQKMILLATVIMATGCASMVLTPNVYKMVPRGAEFAITNSGLTIRIHNVSGGESTSIWTGSKIDGPNFLAALALAIDEHGYFGLMGPDDATSYILAAEIKDQRQPLISLDMTVGLTVDYGLFDQDENMIWQKVVVNEFTVKLKEQLLGVKRLNMANEGAVRENIGAALKEIYALDLK